MAGWSVTGNSKDVEYTHRWAIQNFDRCMETGGEKIESGSFCIPGVPGKFHLVVHWEEEDHYSHSGDRFYKRVPSRVKLGGQELDAKFYFSVTLHSTNRVEWVTATGQPKPVESHRAAGELDVIKEGAETQSGKFGDPAIHNFFHLPCHFRPNFDLEYDGGRDFYEAGGFFTTGTTCLLNLVTRITIAGKVTSLGGTAAEGEVEQNRLLDLQPLLSDPKHSDIVLKCGGTRFPCHKAILAVRSAVFDRMFDQNMMEAQTGEVDISDVDPETLKLMLEFIYSGQVEDENYTAELLYAADKYELSGLVNLCANQFKSEVTPDTAAGIILLADRHCLTQLKQEVMMKIVAEKTRYLASPEFKSQMEKDPGLLMELFSM